MKKVIAILLALLLPLGASAETIAQKIGAPEYVSDAHWEANEAFYTVKVERITLGYMRVLDRDNPEQVLVIPVWDFFGRVDKDDGTSVPRYDEPGATLLTLNAIDGTVIDRKYGY